MNIFDEKLNFEEKFCQELKIYTIKFQIPEFEKFISFFPKSKYENKEETEKSYYKCIDNYFEIGQFIIEIDFGNLDAEISDELICECADTELTGSWKYERFENQAILEWKTPYWFEKSNYLSDCDLGTLRMRLRDVYVDS
jgi:hypothetical protein